MNRVLFFFALLATSMVGCTSVSKLAAEGPPRATLEVVNQTNYLQQITLDGWTLGSIERGKRARFRRLRPGVWNFFALSSTGVRTTRKISLLRGQIAAWNLLPKEAGTEFPVPPEFAEITLVNQAKRDLSVQLSGRPAQSLFNGDTLRLLDIEPGARQLVIEVPGTSYHREMQLTVDEKKALSIDLIVDVGSIKIRNSTGEKVQLLLDGLAQPLIENGSSHELSDVLVGVRKLRAHGLKTGRKYYKTLSVGPNEKLGWNLSASEGRLEVVNKSGEDVSVAVDGKELGTLSATQSRSFVDLPLGHRRVTATGQSSRYQWTIDVPLRSGQSHRWTLRNNVGTGYISNTLSEPIQVHVDGKRRAKIAPGESLFLDELKVGPRLIRVFGESSKSIQERHLVVSSTTTAHWEVMAPQARLQVNNRGAEAVMIYCDGKAVGRVLAGQEMVFTQLPPGTHLIESRGEVSVVRNRSTLALKVAALVVWDVTTQSGTVNVHNQSGEVLLAAPALQVQQRQLEQDAKAAYRVPIGHRVLHFIGAQSGQSYFRRFTVSTQQDLSWTIPALKGVVHIFNRTQEIQSILVDRLETAEIPAQSDRIINLRAGGHRLVAVGKESRQAQQGSVVVFAGVSRTWEIRRQLGKVRITNKSAETLDLYHNGLPLGYLSAGQSSVFGPMKPGRQTLSAQGRWSRAIYDNSVQVLGGQVDHWQIEPAHGQLRVSNKRDEPIRVLMNGVETLEVAANKTVQIQLALGPHLVELIGKSSHAIFTHRLRIRPDRSYSVYAHLGPALLAVVNRLDVALTIRINERPAGTVAAGATAEIPIQERGRITVYADQNESRRAWHRQFVLNDDRVLHWVISE